MSKAVDVSILVTGLFPLVVEVDAGARHEVEVRTSEAEKLVTNRHLRRIIKNRKAIQLQCTSTIHTQIESEYFTR